MVWARKIISIAVSLLFIAAAFAQHPNRKKIDNLKKQLPLTHGIQRVDCLNALSEEFWWPPRVYPDSISMWAIEAIKDATNNNYTSGIATASMHLGVSEIYRKNFLTAEKYLRNALLIFDSIHDKNRQGWCNLWIGQTLYSENRFTEALSFFTKSLTYLTVLDDHEGEGKAWAWMSFLYAATGDYEKSFEYCTKSLLMRQKMSDHVCVAASLANMGYLYKSAGDNEDALDYYRQGMQYGNIHGINYYAANWNYFDEPIGAIYQMMDNPDSSLYYLQKAIQIDPGNQMTRISFGETLLLKKEYDSALSIFLKPIDHFRKGNDQWDLMRILLDAAKALEKENKNSAALAYALDGFLIAQKANVKPYTIQGYLLLASIYKDLKKNDSAYFFMQQYTALKDSVTNQQFLWRLTNYKKQTEFKKQIEELSMLEKDNKIKEEKLKNAYKTKWLFIIGLIIIVMSGMIVYIALTLKRKNEKLKSEHEQAVLKNRAAELEMQALRAQMNPHFIFNCLSSINRFILKNKAEEASDYLTKFSRLIRMVLSNSQKSFITLEDELDMLRLYLEMERLRFKNSFDYSITFKNAIDVNNVFVPPLLLQPFAENAIWHGLMHKEGNGRLEIVLNDDGKILTCIISDNGIGRTEAARLKSKTSAKEKSMGMTLTLERLALINNDAENKTHFTLEDIVDEKGNAAGTRVTLKLHYKNLAELTV